MAALDAASGSLAWELRVRRLVPDLTLVGETLVVEFKWGGTRTGRE